MTLIRAACVLAILCYAALLVPVARRVRRRKEARHFLLYLAAMLAWQSGQAIVAFTSDPQVALLGYRLVAALAPSLGISYVLFVRDLLGKPTPRWLVGVGYLLSLVVPFAVVLTGSGGIVRVYAEPGSALFLPELSDVLVALGSVVYICLIYALFLLVQALRRTTAPFERNRLLYLMIGVPIVMVGSALNVSPVLRSYPADTIANVINALLTAFVILRYQLLDIQVVIGKGLRYSATTVVVSAIYFLFVSLAVQVFHIVSGYQVALLSVLMAIVAAIVVQPLRDVIQDRVDRHFFRERYDATRMLQRLSTSSASLVSVKTLTNMILAEVRHTMHVERTAFFLRNDDGCYVLEAAMGISETAEQTLRPDHPLVAHLAQRRTVLSAQIIARLPLVKAFRLAERKQWDDLAPELLVPVVMKSVLIGLIVFGPKQSGAEYNADDLTTLMTLANQTAVALENARLYAAVRHQLQERERAEARIRESLHEKEALLKEIHHRVKNNLQVIYSLLSLQARQASDGAMLAVLQDSQNRVRSMALIHEKLYQSANLADIDFSEYLRSLAAQLHRSYSSNGCAVRLDVSGGPICLPLNVALPCALVASELISNALKHAFKGRSEGLLQVRLRRTVAGLVELEVADDGVGLPQDSDPTRPPTLGMQLVKGLVRQLDGNMSVETGAGSRFLVTFPVQAAFPPAARPNCS